MVKQITLKVDNHKEVKASPGNGNRFTRPGLVTTWKGMPNDDQAGQNFMVTFTDELQSGAPGWPFDDAVEPVDKTLIVPRDGTITTAKLKDGQHDWKYIVTCKGAKTLDPRIIVREDMGEDDDGLAFSARDAYLMAGSGFLAGLVVGLLL
jgi:hypothetical protein